MPSHFHLSMVWQTAAWGALFVTISVVVRKSVAALVPHARKPELVGCEAFDVLAYSGMSVAWMWELWGAWPSTLLPGALFSGRGVSAHVFDVEQGFYIAMMVQEWLTGSTDPSYWTYQAHHAVSVLGLLLARRACPLLALIAVILIDVADVTLHIRSLLRRLGNFPLAARRATWVLLVAFIALRCVGATVLLALVAWDGNHVMILAIGCFVQALTFKWTRDIWFATGTI